MEPGGYHAHTLQREANVQPEPLRRIASALEELGEPVVFPAHPRTTAALEAAGIVLPETVRVLPPVGYLDFAALASQARVILTDSGGVHPVRDAQDDDRVGGDARDRLEPPGGQRPSVDRHGHPQCGSRPRAPAALRRRTGLGENR